MHKTLRCKANPGNKLICHINNCRIKSHAHLTIADRHYLAKIQEEDEEGTDQEELTLGLKLTD